jgi:hypothetical protein
MTVIALMKDIDQALPGQKKTFPATRFGHKKGSAVG